MAVLNNTKFSQGFTLVELAIVIVIIGLLVGGVLQRQELIQQAKYRNMIKNVEMYKAAMLTFKSKYNCMAGDCPNAWQFFSGNNCGTNIVISSTNTTGCNGDGNQILNSSEGQIVWAHLNYAKIITSSFTTGYKTIVKVGVDLPSVPVDDGVGISAIFSQGDASNTTCGYSQCSTDSSRVNILGGFISENVFSIGSIRPTGWNAQSQGAFLTPEQAEEIDIKFDDGLIFRGAISGFKGRLVNGSGGDCANDQATGPSAGVYCTKALCPTQYNLENCMMVFDMGM